MNERLFKNVLEEGLQEFVDNPVLLERFFQHECQLAEAEAKIVRAYFTMRPDEGQHGGPPSIIYGYPRSTGPFPCWAILLLGDRSKQRFLGDDAGTAPPMDTEEDLEEDPAIGLVRLAEYTIGLDVYVPDHPDVCIYYYNLLRHIVFQAVPTLQAAPNYLENVEFSGADIAPDPRYLPENMWIRRMTVTFFTEEAAWEARNVVTSVDGAFFNDGEESAGVTKNVETY